jgi:signal transduction histidine kinase
VELDDVPELSAREQRLLGMQEAIVAQLLSLSSRLDAVIGRASNAIVQQRIAETVDGLESVAHRLRAMTMQLQSAGSREALGARLSALTRDAGSRMGCMPRIVLTGPVDTAVDAALGEDILAVAEEALRNVVQHAYAGTIEVSLVVDDAAVTLAVRDDGVGPNDEPTSGTGLARLAALADARGGTSEIAANTEGFGSTLTWTVPR